MLNQESLYPLTLSECGKLKCADCLIFIRMLKEEMSLSCFDNQKANRTLYILYHKISDGWIS
jgi:hypothetical protein